MVVLYDPVQLVFEFEKFEGRTPLDLAFVCSLPLGLRVLTVFGAFLIFQHEIFHNVLNFHADETAGDRGELDLGGGPFDRLQFEEILRRKNLNI